MPGRVQGTVCAATVWAQRQRKRQWEREEERAGEAKEEAARRRLSGYEEYRRWVQVEESGG